MDLVGLQAQIDAITAMDNGRVLVALVGLPRSGKSTSARWLAGLVNAPIVCRDAIRLALHGRRFAVEAEKMVDTIDTVMIKALFISGHRCVIVDETNVTRKHRKSLQSPYWKVIYGIENTPAGECIRRARADGDEYIVPVIERMAGMWEDPALDDLTHQPEQKPLPVCGGPEGRTQ